LNVFEAVILGLIQGLTEFLPVSSSGHLLLMQEFLGISSPGMMLEVVLHLGTLAAVCAFYWTRIVEIIKKPTPTLWLLVIATLPTVAAALLFGDVIDAAFGSVAFLPFAFLITSVILCIGEACARYRQRNGTQRKRANLSDALVMGVAQAVAIVPGVSRSGATVSSGLVSGLLRPEAARFSFLMSIPAILGSLVLTIKDAAEAGAASLPLIPLLIGAVVAAVSGFFAITIMLKVLQKYGLIPFAAYTALLGVVLLFIV